MRSCDSGYQDSRHANGWLTALAIVAWLMKDDGFTREIRINRLAFSITG